MMCNRTSENPEPNSFLTCEIPGLAPSDHPGMTQRKIMSDNDDVPFNRNFPLQPGVVEEVRPGVRRVLCKNPSPFTFTGTVSYIVGTGNVAIIDPGPDD